MTISLVLVQIWIEQFKRLPPDNINEYPIEAKIAWRRLTSR